VNTPEPPPIRGPGLRERKKAATRLRIQETALALFLDQGYDATTVEQIAATADVSHMTFFRHFPTKEAVVETDDYDPLIAELIRRRPAQEHPLTALHRALAEGLAAVYRAHRDVLLARTRLILTTPALRAHMADNQYATERLFTDALAARADTQTTYELRVHAAAALAALNVALSTWVHADGNDQLPQLVDRAFHALLPPADQNNPPGLTDARPTGSAGRPLCVAERPAGNLAFARPRFNRFSGSS